MRQITDVILHCSATRPEWMERDGLVAQRAEIRRWHTTPPRDWNDIGYHWLVGREGDVLPGRDEATVGAHVQGMNARSIGVCLIGGHGGEEYDAPEEHFTSAQLAAAAKLVAEIVARYPGARVTGHNDHANKACPCFNAGDWWARVQPKPAQPAPSFWATLAQFFSRIFSKGA